MAKPAARAASPMRRSDPGDTAAKVLRMELTHAVAAAKRANARVRELEDQFAARGYLPNPELTAEHRRLATELAGLGQMLERKI